MDKTNEETVIFLKDLIFTALHRWKAMLLASVILAGLLGGYMAYSGRSSTGADPQVYAAQLEQYEASRQVLLEMVAKQQKNIESHQNYMANSLLMEIDPFHHYQVKFTVYADTEYFAPMDSSYQTADKTSHILSAYYAKFTSTQTAQVLAKAVGTEAMYLSELCQAELPQTGAWVTITIVYPTQEGAELLLDLLTKQFEQVYSEFNKTIYPHNAQLLESSVSRAADPELIKMQNDAEAYLVDLTEGLSQTQAKLAALSAPVAPGTTSPASLKKILIFAALGAVAGGGLVAMYAWIEMVASQKVYSSRALRSRVGVKVLGCICTKVPRNAIDRFLSKLEGRDLSEPEARAAVLARDVYNRCGGVSKLLVTGDMEENQYDFIVSAFTQSMPGVQVINRGSILRCAEAVDALKECDKVLLVEKCGISRYNNVASQCQKAEDYKTEILGCILMDG